jgi:2-polyprenyl-6-methoxyphenol hydroxylase-like FAD-dependent oxidoreductase
MSARTPARVAVVGGSIAGCASAIALSRAGQRAVVYERSRSGLADRGLGIAIPPPLLAELIEAGYVDEELPVCSAQERVWVLREPGSRRQSDAGRELWRQPSRIVTCNWGLLWRALRQRVPDSDYRGGRPVVDLRTGPDGGATIVTAIAANEGGGEREEAFDAVVGADGYRSIVRPRVAPGEVPSYAGYALWRASVPLARLTDGERVAALLARSYYTVAFPGGHAIVYLIPETPRPGQPPGLLVNWALYARPPASVSCADGLTFPPGAAGGVLADHARDLAERHFPLLWAELVHRSDPAVLAVQPVIDLQLSRYQRAPLLVAGDAAAITRPHTASGAVKALQDARCLEAVFRQVDGVPAALRRYDELRREAGNRLVALGRRIGRDQVEDTPAWGELTASDLDAWTRRTLDGQAHYLYGRAAADGSRSATPAGGR